MDSSLVLLISVYYIQTQPYRVVIVRWHMFELWVPLERFNWHSLFSYGKSIRYCSVFVFYASYAFYLWSSTRIGFKANKPSYKPSPYLFDIKSISLLPLLWMNVKLDFICIGFDEPGATGSKRKIQMRICASAGNRTSGSLLSSTPL